MRPAPAAAVVNYYYSHYYYHTAVCSRVDWGDGVRVGAAHLGDKTNGVPTGGSINIVYAGPPKPFSAVVADNEDLRNLLNGHAAAAAAER